MASAHDPKWKVAHVPTVKLPFRMPRPTDITARDLARVGVHVHGGFVVATEPSETPETAMRDGELEARGYEREDPYGNHAKVVAIIEWQDEGLFSAAVQKYHSDS